MAKRRGNGEGSVYRRKDGLWVGQYKIQIPTGTKTKYIYSKTRKDAAAKLAQAIADRESGLVFDCGSLTVGEYLGKWLNSVSGTVRERTWKRSEEIVPMAWEIRSSKECCGGPWQVPTRPYRLRRSRISMAWTLDRQ